jgi:fluoride exporter
LDAQELRLVALVALGGALGTTARYGLSGWLTRGSFPWGTFAVNFSGTLLLVLLYFLFLDRGYFSSEFRSFLFVGVFGGYTTLSTFGLETVTMLRGGQLALAGLNIFLNAGLCLLGGIVGAMIGIALGGGSWS